MVESPPESRAGLTRLKTLEKFAYDGVSWNTTSAELKRRYPKGRFGEGHFVVMGEKPPLHDATFYVDANRVNGIELTYSDQSGATAAEMETFTATILAEATRKFGAPDRIVKGQGFLGKDQWEWNFPSGGASKSPYILLWQTKSGVTRMVYRWKHP